VRQLEVDTVKQAKRAVAEKIKPKETKKKNTTSTASNDSGATATVSKVTGKKNNRII
jgi:hypothetical protein